MTKWLDNIINKLIVHNTSTEVKINLVTKYEKSYRIYTITLTEPIDLESKDYGDDQKNE
jgi:hypothetical protein